MDNQIAGLSIRPLDRERDRAALSRLAQLDTVATPAGSLIGAEIEGRLLAATSLETGETISDPFARTAELRALLELRAAQIAARENADDRPAVGFAAAITAGGRARAALAGSPPGAGGRLLTLPH